MESSGDANGYRAEVKMRMETREEVDKWLVDFQTSSTLTWRKARTYPESGRYNAYRADFRCQHKTYGAGKSSRNTNCPATLFLVLKRSIDDRRSSKRDVSAITAERLTELFRQGHSPSSALDTLKYDLQEEEGD
ncbi:uncharacterized protein ACJ7VT_006532, partial [Polymixia lowei]